jgi:dUTP pyrophosphatase
MEIKIKKLKAEAELPSYAHPGDAGLDIRSLEDYTLQPGEQKIFMSGFALEFPEGYMAIIKDRGSMAKAKLHTTGGVFDAGYRGEYNISLVNLGPQPYQISHGDKIAQLVILPVTRATITEVKTLTDSSRGKGAFGSTGK